MKKPEEIKEGLELCTREVHSAEPMCARCPYDDGTFDMVACTGHMSQDAFAYIQQLEAKVVKQSQRIDELVQELEVVRRVRDAAVDSLRGDCRHCKYITYPSCEEPCRSCIDGCSYRTNKIKWEWRGVCPENTEVQEDV